MNDVFELSPNNFVNRSIDEQCQKSFSLVENSRKINIFLTMLILAFGLVGNVLIFLVFCQKRFRKNSSNVFLLCLALNDSLFLVIHFFENTIRSIHYVYLIGDQNHGEIHKRFSQLIQLLNITDNFDLGCRFINYLRQVISFLISNS